MRIAELSDPEAFLRVVKRHTAGSSVGSLYRAGHTYTQAPLDHDWASLATGKAIPHGLYDFAENTGYVQIGTSRDTHEFAIDSLRYWWQHMGETAMEPPPRYCYCAMASNSSRSYLFKATLQDLAVELGIDIRVAHYPPYNSQLPETA